MRDRIRKLFLVGNQKGIALLITLVAVMIMTFLAVEISYNSHVELVVGVSQVDRLKAYYLAKSGVELSVLRIFIYRKAMAMFGPQLGPQKNLLDMIWQLPFSWPPLIPPGVSDFDKDAIQSAVKKSLFDKESMFQASIDGEGGKIDVNDLDSPSPVLKQAVYDQLVQILKNRMDADDDWAHDHRDLRPEEIINNIADWIDADNDSLNGGDEQSYYASTNPRIKPSNRPLKTLDELHMVKGVTDDIFKILAPRLTVYGAKGININQAGAEVLKSVDKTITDDVVKEIIKRRNDPAQGPFQNLQDFVTFLQGLGLNVDRFTKTDKPIPLLFDTEYNFRITSTGIYRKAQREIIAIVYDFDKVKGQLLTYMNSPSPGASGTPAGSQPPASPGTSPGTSPGPSPAPNSGSSSGPTGPPTIVFWQEF